MELDDLRRRAAFQNTVDVWIAACAERGADWRDAGAYAGFVGHLRGSGVALRGYSLCVSDSESPDAAERDKAAFAEEVSSGAGTHAVRLSDAALAAIRGYGR